LTVLPRRVPYFSTRALLTIFGLQSMVKRLYWFFNVKKSSLCLDCFTDYSQNDMSSPRSYRSYTNSLPSYLNCTLPLIQAVPPTAIKWLVHYTFFMNCSGQKLWESHCAYTRNHSTVPSRKRAHHKDWFSIGPQQWLAQLMLFFHFILSSIPGFLLQTGEWLPVHVGSDKRWIHVQ
jgi:hypothetical protein